MKKSSKARGTSGATRKGCEPFVINLQRSQADSGVSYQLIDAGQEKAPPSRIKVQDMIEEDLQQSQLKNTNQFHASFPAQPSSFQAPKQSFQMNNAAASSSNRPLPQVQEQGFAMPPPPTTSIQPPVSSSAPPNLHYEPQPVASLCLPSSTECWFDLHDIADLERDSFPEFFSGHYPSKSPETYKEMRNFMILLYRANPAIYLSASALRRQLSGDVATMMRVHRFLDRHGLINFQIDPETKPLARGICVESSYEKVFVNATNKNLLERSEDIYMQMKVKDNRKVQNNVTQENNHQVQNTTGQQSSDLPSSLAMIDPVCLRKINLLTHKQRPCCSYCNAKVSFTWWQERPLSSEASQDSQGSYDSEDKKEQDQDKKEESQGKEEKNHDKDDDKQDEQNDDELSKDNQKKEDDKEPSKDVKQQDDQIDKQADAEKDQNMPKPPASPSKATSTVKPLASESKPKVAAPVDQEPILMCKLCYERIELPHIRAAIAKSNYHEELLETNPPQSEAELQEYDLVKQQLDNAVNQIKNRFEKKSLSQEFWDKIESELELQPEKTGSKSAVKNQTQAEKPSNLSEQQKTQLLAAVQIHGPNWKKVANQTKLKSGKDALQEFLKLKTADVFGLTEKYLNQNASLLEADKQEDQNNDVQMATGTVQEYNQLDQIYLQCSLLQQFAQDCQSTSGEESETIKNDKADDQLMEGDLAKPRTDCQPPAGDQANPKTDESFEQEKLAFQAMVLDFKRMQEEFRQLIDRDNQVAQLQIEYKSLQQQLFNERVAMTVANAAKQNSK